LRSKLDARKKVIDREDAQKAEAQKSAEAQRAAATAAANANNAQNAASTSSTPATPGEAATPGTAAAPKPASATATPAPTTAAAATPPPAATAAPSSAGGESHGAEVVKTSAPEYPPDAARKHQEGWVEVEFTITADGQVAGATVVNANPARVFNASAIRAVQSWTFRPRVDNGKAVDEKMRRRIEFRLSG
jgi:periplasmic protein TonB